MNDAAETLTAKDKLLAIMEAEKLTVESVFVPWSQSRNKDECETDYAGKPIKGRPRRTLNWRVTLKRNGREIVTTDYSAGIAHCPIYKTNQRDRNLDAMIQAETEGGFALKLRAYAGGFVKSSTPILPDHVDVLASLAMDSDVLEAGDFDSWASNFGYDSDSRKAEAIYRACLDIALKLRVGLGDALLQQLREAAAEY